MAIAIEQDQGIAAEQVISVDIRTLAAAATLCRKARAAKRHGGAWHANTLVHGGYVYGGDALETTVQVPHGGEYAHRAFAVPYDSITAAAKGRKGMVELRMGSITFPDGAVFAWKHDAEAADEMQASRPVGIGENGWAADYDAATFRNAVAMVAPSASADESRPVLTGVYVDPGARKWVATDSYRMMIASVQDAGNFDRFGDGAIIPAKALRIAAAVKRVDYYQVVVEARDPKCAHGYAEIMAGVRVDTVAASVCAVIRTRLIDGQYPNYSALIPEGFVTSVDCDGDALRMALASAKNVAARNSAIRITADSSTSVLRITVRAMHDAPASEWSVPCHYRGDTDGELTIGVNAEFASDGAECIGTSIVTLNVISPLHPILLTSADGSTADPHYVCMPMRV